MVDEFSEIMNHLSENARFALQKADFYSKRYNQGYMGTEHLLMGILAQDTSTGARLLRENGVDIDQVERAQGKVAVDVPAAPHRAYYLRFSSPAKLPRLCIAR